MRRMMRVLGLAEYGGDELVIVTLAMGMLAYIAWRIHPALIAIPAIPFAIVVWFFRDPNRTGPANPEIMLSPADGTVSDITEVDEARFINGRAVRIGIFLSPFNVHVNRAPCEALVCGVEYKAGEFLPAYNPDAPTRNESAALGLQLDSGLILVVKQITGILARRIVCEADAGERLTRGERYGMIKFGSRTELYVPVQACGEVLVKLGDKVTGGQTPLCALKAVPPPAVASSQAVVVSAAQPGVQE